MTVGDDNALSVSRLVVEASPQLTVTLDQQHTQPSAHSSSITGENFAENLHAVCKRSGPCHITANLPLVVSQLSTIVCYSPYAGVDWVCDDLVVTTSVDQRLSLWTIDPLTLRSSFIHDVADPAALSTFSTR